MIKKMTIIALTAASMTGCALGPYQPGLVYSNMSAPMDVRDNAVGCSKRGESSMTNILGLIGPGDASIEKAKASAGMTKVGSVDVQYTNFLSLFSSSTTTVCGE